MATDSKVPPARHETRSRSTAKTVLSAKVTTATLAGAVATVVWTILGATVLKSTFTAAELSALVAGSTTILVALFGFLKYESDAFMQYLATHHR